MGISVCFRDYGGGLIEWGYSKREPVSGKRVKSRYPKVKYEGDEAETRERAARRAGTVIRRMIMARRLDYLLTLTYRENVICRRRAVRDLSTFMDRVRKEKPGFSWVAVSERQKRGAWHWHIAVSGFQDVRLLRSIWKGVVGEGNIDVRGPKSGGRLRWGRLRLAYYLAKYIYKCSQETREGDHRYFRSRDGEESDVVKIMVDWASTAGVWVQEIVSSSGLRVRQHFETAYGGWGATWEAQFRRSMKRTGDS